MYEAAYSEEITRKLKKLKRRDPSQYEAVSRKIKQILENPEHRYKELRYGFGGVCRVHLGHFVLVFVVDHKKETVSFEDYDHHDRIYLA